MNEETHITIKSDSPIAISSSALGANINALGFNIDLIAAKNPNLAIAIMSLYEQAKNIHSDDPLQPDEDFKLVDKTLDEVVMNNYAAKEPIDVEARFTPEGQLKLNYKFQLDRCRDAAIAYQYARIFNAIQQDTVELLLDDKGIERKLIDIPKRGGEPLSEGYERALRDMARIQNFFKVRLPNPLSEHQKLKKNDYWSIQTLAKIIDEGKADIKVTNLSFVLLRDDIDKLREETAGESAMALGGDPKLNMLSILGVTDFPNIELILPRTKVEVTDLGDGTAKLDVSALEKPFLRYHEDKIDIPEASWS